MAEIVEGLAQAREAVAVVVATPPSDNSVKGKKGTNETSTLIAVIGEIVPLETLRTETPAPAVETPVEVAAPATDATEVRPATAPITPEVRPASAVDAVTPARDNSGVGAVRVSGGSGEKLNNSGVETEGDSHGGEDKVRVGGQGRGFGSDSLSDYIVDDDTLSGAGSGGNGETPVAADVEEPDISEDLGNVEAGAENVGGGIMAMLLSQSSKTSGETDFSASVGGENIAAVQNAMQHEAENVENILDQ